MLNCVDVQTPVRRLSRSFRTLDCGLPSAGLRSQTWSNCCHPAGASVMTRRTSKSCAPNTVRDRTACRFSGQSDYILGLASKSYSQNNCHEACVDSALYLLTCHSDQTCVCRVSVPVFISRPCIGVSSLFRSVYGPTLVNANYLFQTLQEVLFLRTESVVCVCVGGEGVLCCVVCVCVCVCV